jgi:hypothetical protein
VVPGFRCPFLPNMPSSMTPGSSVMFGTERRCRHGLSLSSEQLGTPAPPAIRFMRARISGLPGSRICDGLPGCLPPVRIGLVRPAHGDFYFQAFNGSVALPVAGYNYNSDWTPLLAGLSPAGMAASLAAPEPYVRLSRIRLPSRVGDGTTFCMTSRAQARGRGRLRPRHPNGLHA